MAWRLHVCGGTQEIISKQNKELCPLEQEVHYSMEARLFTMIIFLTFA